MENKMKKLKIILAFGLILLLGACDVEYFNNPNAPSSAPTSALFNNNVKRMVDATTDMWFSGRFTYVTMQYWQQSEYGDEDRYVYRESMRQYQNTFYEILENYREIIRLNEDPSTAGPAAASGASVNQIATCRVLMAYVFDIMTTTWGDIPYYSYGSDNASFQALGLSGSSDPIITPVYATQEEIFLDILNELSAANDQFDVTLPGIVADRIYGEDVAAWKMFANSLRLRIAHRIEGASSAATAHITDAIADGVFTSNANNAMFKYESSDANAAEPYTAWYVGNRSDFAVSHSFVTLLQGNNLVDHGHVDLPVGGSPNPFLGLADPRLAIYAQPNKNGDYVGMFIAESSAESATFTIESLPGTAIIEVPDFSETLMEYAEVAFIQSERAGWSQADYVAGITASMEKWGVAAEDITAYVGAVPAASDENVMTQKYIALYMQGAQSWNEYRRTGFPKTLIPVYSSYSVQDPSFDAVDPPAIEWRDEVFNPLVDVTDLPYRMRYPAQEQTLNGANRKVAVDALSDGDVIYSKLWWDKN
jgi:hypothetical protein